MFFSDVPKAEGCGQQLGRSAAWPPRSRREAEEVGSGLLPPAFAASLIPAPPSDLHVHLAKVSYSARGVTLGERKRGVAMMPCPCEEEDRCHALGTNLQSLNVFPYPTPVWIEVASHKEATSWKNFSPLTFCGEPIRPRSLCSPEPPIARSDPAPVGNPSERRRQAFSRHRRSCLDLDGG